MSLEVVAYVVIGERGYRAVVLEEHVAIEKAAAHHGFIEPCVLLRSVKEAMQGMASTRQQQAG